MNRLVDVHLQRLGKDVTIYSEELIEDNGVRLKTQAKLDAEHAARYSRSFSSEGFIRAGQTITCITKYRFYSEWFDILEMRGEAGELLGYYCDICTPLARTGASYNLIDLFLDLWVYPDGSVEELDWDEYQEAAAAGLLSTEWQMRAPAALTRLVADVRSGRFYDTYLR